MRKLIALVLVAWDSHANQSTYQMDVNGGSTADGANVQIWGCSGGTNQQWSFLAP